MKKKLLLIPLCVVALVIGVTSVHTNKLTSLNPGLGKSIVDLHVHVAGLGYGDSGCFINQQMRDNIRFGVYLWAMGVKEEELKQHGDQLLFERVSAAIKQSKTISHGVTLAMDGFVTNEGLLVEDKTQIYVPNDYVATHAARYDNLLFGASVNPNRTDAIPRLHEVHAQGAVLIKWIPSIMNINPADPKHELFYATMRDLNLPLLTHTGQEKSFADAKDELADPQRLTLPLDIGVTVIAAHIATTGHSQGEDNFKRILSMFDQHENLLVDISSLTQVNKRTYLKQALAIPGLQDRMLYGTDWPLQFFPIVSPWYHLSSVGVKDAWQASGLRNQWDRDVAIKKAMGVPNAVFSRSASLFNLP